MKTSFVILIAITLLGGCKGRPSAAEISTSAKATPSQDSASSQSSAPSPYNRPANASQTAPEVDPQAVPRTLQYSDPPAVDVGLAVEQAYAAIPHRRTVWVDSETTVPSEEKAYLKVMFQVLDEGVAVRVAGLQNFSNGNYDSVNVDTEFDRLISFVLSMPVPKGLGSYHKDIVAGLSGQRQFFADWKSQRDGFAFTHQIGNHPGVQASSSALRTAYGELMSKYPNESQANKDAFFDYHCALDFL